jgi:hypothetical protein
MIIRIKKKQLEGKIFSKNSIFDFFVECLESHKVAKLEFSLWIFFTYIFEMSRLDCGDIVRSLSAGE